MRSLRAQYFLTFAVSGSLLPYTSVYFKQHGLTDTQVGYVLAAGSVAIMLTPILVTLLADTRIDARRIMAAILLLSAIPLLAIPLLSGFWPVLLMWTAHNLAFMPMTPLQDGITFAIQKRRQESGLPVEAYHRVRVWGTIGFMLPSALLFGFLRAGAKVDLALLCGAAFAVIAAINALLMPNPQIRTQPSPAAARPPSADLPTMEAARALFTSPLLVFCLASFLINVAAASYYAFYPVYLTERIGLHRQWLGPTMNLGVAIEIFFMLGFGYLVSRFGLKQLMVIGVLCIAARMALLAATANVVAAVGVQVFHGFMILVMHVAPPTYLNHHAKDRYRHSMQGLFTVLIIGLGRIVGNLLAGPIARWSLSGLFAVATVISLTAAGLLIFVFSDSHGRHPASTGRQTDRAI